MKKKNDRFLKEDHVRTAWKTEVYPSSLGKKGVPARLADVVHDARLMFASQRIVWNRCLQAIRESEDESRRQFEATGERKWSGLWRNSTELYRIGIKDNPRYPGTFKAWALSFLTGKKKTSLKPPVRHLFVDPLFVDRPVSLLSGAWSLPPRLISHTSSRLCASQVPHSTIKLAHQRWIDDRQLRKTDRSKLTAALKWARKRPGRHARDYKRPRFHRREDCNSTYLHNRTIQFDEKGERAFILTVCGSFKLSRPLPWPVAEIKISESSLSERAGRFFLSLSVQVPKDKLQIRRYDNQILGVDLGVSKAAVSADALTKKTAVLHLPRYWEDERMKLLQKRLRKWTRAMQRRKDTAIKEKRSFTESAGYKEAVAKIQSINLDIVNLRRDAQNKFTTSLARRASCIAVEDLNVAGMTKKSVDHASGAKSLRKRILDTGFAEIRRQIEYKGKRSGTAILVANQFYASTQTCSSCGRRKIGDERLKPKDRIYICPCGLVMDRDPNAALTLAKLGQHHLPGMTSDKAWTCDSGGTKISPLASDTSKAVAEQPKKKEPLESAQSTGQSHSPIKPLPLNP